MKYLKDSGFSAWIRKQNSQEKKPCVVDNDHPRLTSSVVVTFVQVIHGDKVQILFYCFSTQKMGNSMGYDRVW